MLKALDVIYVFDEGIQPSGWKYVVCICPEEGLFYRINSYDNFPIGVPITVKDHSFLKWDSYIECGRYPLEFDDNTIQRAINKNKGNSVHRIAEKHVVEILAAVQLQSTISKDLKRLIQAALSR